MDIRVISVRKSPEYTDLAIAYLQQSWSEVPAIIYKNCIDHCINAPQPLPQWYLLEKEGEIIGCAGLVTNDFISRMDLYPWFCAMFIAEDHRGNSYGSLLLEQAKKDTKAAGFQYLNLCTDHIGYYEKYGFRYIGDGYHPWEESTRIYQLEV